MEGGLYRLHPGQSAGPRSRQGRDIIRSDPAQGIDRQIDILNPSSEFGDAQRGLYRRSAAGRKHRRQNQGVETFGYGPAPMPGGGQQPIGMSPANRSRLSRLALGQMQPVRFQDLRQISVSPDQQFHPGAPRRLPQPTARLDGVGRSEGAIDHPRSGRQTGHGLPRAGRAVRVGEEQQRRQPGDARADSGGGAV